MTTTKTTLGALAHRYVTERTRRGELSDASRRSYLARLASFEQAVGPDREVATITRRHVGAWLDAIGTRAPATRRSYYATVRRFAGWLRAEGYVDVDLLAGTQAPKEPRTVPRNLHADDVARVLAVCDERTRLIALLMLQLGLRRGEVARLCVEDVDVPNRVVRIAGKGSHERVLPIPEQAAEEIRRYIGAHRITTGPVVRSLCDPSRGLTPGRVGAVMTAAMYAAGVKACGWDRVSGHSLRHTACADMLRGGAHVRDVQQVLGHTSIATTERYLPLVVRTLGETVEGRRY